MTLSIDLLSVAPGSISDVPADDLGSLWTVFTKVSGNIKHGRRLENLSWRLWYSQILATSHHHHPRRPRLSPHPTIDSPFLESPPTQHPILVTDIDSASEPDEVTTDGEVTTDDVEHSSPASSVLPSASPKSIARSSSRSRPRTRLANSHPQATTASTLRTACHDRANSTPADPRRPPSFNLGKILTSDLLQLNPSREHDMEPIALETTPSPSPISVNVQPAPNTLDALGTPSVVVLQSTPRPTPPDSPVDSNDQAWNGNASQTVDHLSPQTPGDLAPKAASSSSEMPSPYHPPMTMAPVPVDDPRKKKTFFFKESPGADASSEGSSAASSSKTPIAPLTVPPPPLPAQPSPPVVEELPQVTTSRGVIKQRVTRHHVVGASRHGPTRSKSTAAIVPHRPVAPVRRTTSSSKIQHAPQFPLTTLESTSEVSSAKTIVAAPSPVRVASPPAPPQSSPVRERPSAPEPKKSITTRNGRLEVTTSSDFETTDTEADDSSWASDYSDEDQPVTARPSAEEEEVETGHIAQEAAVEAARQRDLFAKAPTRSYANLAQKRPQSGLLSTLFHPDPNLLPHLPGKAHSTLGGLGMGMRMAPATTLQTRSTAAVPLAAQVNVNVNVTQQPSERPTPTLNANGRPGYRLKGRPEDMEVESSDDEDADEGMGLSKSLAQQKLEALAGRRSAKSTSQVAPPPPMTRADSQQYTSGDHPIMMPDASQPIVLPHPYNLPAPAPPATPRTTRREMLATEMSESVRRNVLWERETARKLWKRVTPQPAGITRTTSTGAWQKRPPPMSAYGDDGFHASGW